MVLVMNESFNHGRNWLVSIDKNHCFLRKRLRLLIYLKKMNFLKTKIGLSSFIKRIDPGKG